MCKLLHQFSLDLVQLGGQVVNVNGKRCVITPIDDNMTETAKGQVFCDFVAFEHDTEHSAGFIKRHFPKDARPAETPIVGNIRKYKPALTEAPSITIAGLNI